ncbi:MAG: hypothetical protein MRQ13_05200, partial [Candidatus Midichloria sp.]|nr:hypothetical protein [Candidatus Midichloria sp.]
IPSFLFGIKLRKWLSCFFKTISGILLLRTVVFKVKKWPSYTELLKNWLLFTDVIKMKETDNNGTLRFLSGLLQLQEKNCWFNTESHLE